MEHWIYNMDFHIALLSLGGNDYACAQLKSCMNMLWRAMHNYTGINGATIIFRLI